MVARRMLAMGKPVADIAEVTELTVAEVASLASRGKNEQRWWFLGVRDYRRTDV